MKVRIVVGEVEIELDGNDITKADVTRWFKRVAMIGALLANNSTEALEPVTESKDLDCHLALAGDDVPMFGFSRWIGTDPEIPDEDAP